MQEYVSLFSASELGFWYSKFVMDDVEIALLLSLYVVLIQTFCECRPSYALQDDIVVECGGGGQSILESQDLQIAVSTAPFYDYRVAAGLICFDDDL